MRRAIVVTLCLASVLPACYRYVPASTSNLTPPGEVRLRLNEAEASRLAGVIAPGTRLVEGQLIEERPDSVMLLVSVFNELQGTRFVNLSQRMNVARAGIVDVERKTLDQTRTVMAAVAGVVLVGSAVGIIIAGGFDSTQGPDDLPPRDLVVPLFKIRW